MDKSETDDNKPIYQDGLYWPDTTPGYWLQIINDPNSTQSEKEWATMNMKNWSEANCRKVN